MRKPVSIESLEGRLLLSTTPNDPRYAESWGLSAIDASSAWDTTRGSAAVVVAGIDTGLDYKHDDLYLNVWINQDEIPDAARAVLKDTDRDGLITFYDLNASANAGKVTDVDANGRIDAADLLTRAKYGGWVDRQDDGGNGYTDDIVGWDFADNDNSPYDRDGHGTHTAGTIGAIGGNGTGVAGVAWRASVMGVKIFGDDGYSASSSQIAAAIRYSADNGARVSNNSWGGGGYSTAIYNAIRYAGAQGQLFVVAAGNDSANLDSRYYDDFPSEYALDNVVVVGATTSAGGRAYYSNYGAANVDLFAPGSRVLSLSAGGGYATMSGTSMAAPHVAGAAALMLAQNPALSTGRLKSRLINAADQTAALANRSVAGGELNVNNALRGETGARYDAAATAAATDAALAVPGGGWQWLALPPGIEFAPPPAFAAPPVVVAPPVAVTPPGASPSPVAPPARNTPPAAAPSPGAGSSAGSTSTSTATPTATRAAGLPAASSAGRALLRDTGGDSLDVSTGASPADATARDNAPNAVSIFSTRRVAVTWAGYAPAKQADEAAPASAIAAASVAATAHAAARPDPAPPAASPASAAFATAPPPAAADAPAPSVTPDNRVTAPRPLSPIATTAAAIAADGSRFPDTLRARAAVLAGSATVLAAGAYTYLRNRRRAAAAATDKAETTPPDTTC